MKKSLIVVAVLAVMFLGAMPVVADETGAGLSLGETVSEAVEKLKLDNLKQGAAIDIVNNKTCYTFTKTIWSPPAKITKDGKEIDNFWRFINIDVGYTSTDKIMAGISANLFKMSDHTDIPIINLFRLDVGGWGGWGRPQIGSGMEGNNEWAGGINFCILKLTK